MKTLCLVLMLSLLSPALCSHRIAAETLKEAAPAVWLGDGVVKVYFVRNMFSPAERELLWEAIGIWTQKARKKGHELSFVPAGETGGLIDCLGCLTIARQGQSLDATRQRVTFNSLRRDDTGRLTSAWIGFQLDSSVSPQLRSLMLQALERGIELRPSQTAKGGHA